ncbi:MAG TPA: UDP-GlcNAc--UDP-phosphate GlcNAc-1-phosphate transferase [Cyclobacteriaceae bacterium]|nr:UDP-GlcNAc--UDP-phosphate GlcNAc-1-phosphate transferase [Cyclobacteriaceae bacterium]
MNTNYYILFAGLLVALELGYFALARRFGILDQPNHRSLHVQPTIRGGGIIFFVAALLGYIWIPLDQPLFLSGLILISVIGFMDDVKGLGSGVRFMIQCMAIALSMAQVGLDVPWYGLGMVFIVGVGLLNAYNFMDGINGITSGYSLVTLGSLVWINMETPFIDKDFLGCLILGVGIFSYFNFRTKAICFAGDVGSLSMGFVLLYAIATLIKSTNQFAYIFLVALYAVDTGLTLLHRMWLRENIFKAHKMHFFQLMVNQFGLSHVKTSLIYSMVQLVINIILIIVISSHTISPLIVGTLFVMVLAVVYGYFKFYYRISH